MTEHRDSPEVEPEQDREPRSTSRRRFARLVESPAARKVALPRLIAAAALALLLALGLAFCGWKLVESWASWVDHLPENQIRFDQIELSPPPDPWLLGGRSKILEEVFGHDKLGSTFSRLGVDLKEIESAFKKNPWVKKVIRIDRSQHGQLIVELEYRKPVAVIDFKGASPYAFPIDEEGVVLSDRDIVWSSNESPFRVEGMDGTLIEIKNIPETSPTPKAGVPWKQKVEGDSRDEPDTMVLRAAGVARFLQEKRRSLKSPRDAPDFVAIYLPGKSDVPYFLADSDNNWVSWGRTPGDEKPGQPTPEARWTMLLEWIKAHGPLQAKGQDYLDFTSTGAKLIPSRSKRPK